MSMPPLALYRPAGYMYCNMPVLTFTQGQRVRFHVMALGTEGEAPAHPEQRSFLRMPVLPSGFRLAHTMWLVVGGDQVGLLKCRCGSPAVCIVGYGLHSRLGNGL